MVSKSHIRWLLDAQSCAATAEKRRKALQERRLAREKAIEDSLHIWEKEILPDWRVVYRKPELRKLWWRGIPTKLRSSLWEKAVGNELALSKGRLQLTDLCASYSNIPLNYRLLLGHIILKTITALACRELNVLYPRVSFHKPLWTWSNGILKQLCQPYIYSTGRAALSILI